LQETGHGLVQTSLKSGLGKVMNHFGLGKPDGTKGNPLHVVDDGLGGLPGGNAVPDPMKGLGGLFGGGQQGGMGGTIFSLAQSFIPGLAEGASDVYPGGSYVVGDGGEPELFTPSTSGSITPAHKIGGNSYNITVNAPNAEIGAENRIYEAAVAAHHAAVSDSVVAGHEYKERTPQRSGGHR
jgi:hypothetical protein